MKVAVLKERFPNENRTAIHPDIVKKLVESGVKVCVEKGAGERSSITDEELQSVGATLSGVPLEILADANAVFKVRPSSDAVTDELTELSLMPEGSILIGFLSPYENKGLIEHLARRKITTFAMEFIPRITRAQTMDALSSQTNLAGYKAVIEAANQFGRALPMMMTAAGTLTPAKVLVIGAGVAGLQAIATAKRLGAVVSAFDVRVIAKEQVESLGATFIEVPHDESADLETTGGYAREASEDYKRKQQALLAETIRKTDIIITTALIPGKKAPTLVTKEMVESMKPGSVIVDMATAQGGNCELSNKDKIVTHREVKIIGYSNLPAHIAADATKLYARNIFNFFMLLYNKENNTLNINIDDEIIKGALVTHNGEIVHPTLKEAYNNG